MTCFWPFSFCVGSALSHGAHPTARRLVNDVEFDFLTFGVNAYYVAAIYKYNIWPKSFYGNRYIEKITLKNT